MFNPYVLNSCLELPIYLLAMRCFWKASSQVVEPSRVSVFVIVTLTVATAQFAFSKEIAR